MLEKEMQRRDFLAWYRNPSRSSQDSLGIAYTEDKHVKIIRPDFIFFSTQPDGTIAADIVDPHGIHFSDALPKLQGLANYAAAHPGIFRRIDVVAQVEDRLRVLDLIDPTICKEVATAHSIKILYESEFANNL